MIRPSPELFEQIRAMFDGAFSDLTDDQIIRIVNDQFLGLSITSQLRAEQWEQPQ